MYHGAILFTIGPYFVATHPGTYFRLSFLIDPCQTSTGIMLADTFFENAPGLRPALVLRSCINPHPYTGWDMNKRYRGFGFVPVLPARASATLGKLLNISSPDNAITSALFVIAQHCYRHRGRVDPSFALRRWNALPSMSARFRDERMNQVIWPIYKKQSADGLILHLDFDAMNLCVLDINTCLLCHKQPGIFPAFTRADFQPDFHILLLSRCTTLKNLQA